LAPEANCHLEKQIIHRLPPDFVRRILADFNDRKLDALTAAAHLGITRSRLYQLRTAFLRNGQSFKPKPSGGARGGAWPTQVHDFLQDFLPLQNPPNYQLVADELQRLCDFKPSP